MPELPEVETTKRGISPFLLNQKIKKIIVRQPKLRWQIPEIFSKLHNISITGLSRRAKYLIIHTEQGDIIGHLGMSGSLQIIDKVLFAGKHDHLDIVLDNGKVLRYNDPRRFGAWLWAERAENLAILQKLGVEPLSDEFNAEYLFSQTRKRTIPIKSLIMHNPIVVGIGNIYANESLFLCKINPLLPANTLSLEQCQTLTNTIKTILQKAIVQGGTTLKDFKQPDGKLGYFAQELLIYGKKGKPCPECGTLIANVMIGQRNSFFCPRCQAV